LAHRGHKFDRCLPWWFLPQIFGRIAKLPSDGTAPYVLMVFAGMLPWTLFSTGLTEASNSLVSNANLISKVLLPRLLVPITTIVVVSVDFSSAFA
jgi:lipopolysaccharide transport system permease protein